MSRRRLFMLVKLLISVSILVILVYTIKLDRISEAFTNARHTGLIAAASLLPVNIGLQFIKWRILLQTVKPQTSFLEVLGSLLVGFTLGLGTPGRIGEFGRAFAVKDTDPLKVLGLAVIDKLFNLSCIALFGGLGILTLPGMVLQQNVYIILSCVILYLIGVWIILFILTHPAGVRGVLYSISLMLPKREKIKTFISCLDGISVSRSKGLLIVSALFYFTFIMQFFFLVQSFSRIDFPGGLSGLASVIFVKTFLPISVGGLGVGELASTRLLQLYSVETAAAFNASLVLFALNVLTPGLFGFLFIPRLKFTKD